MSRAHPTGKRTPFCAVSGREPRSFPVRVRLPDDIVRSALLAFGVTTAESVRTMTLLSNLILAALPALPAASPVREDEGPDGNKLVQVSLLADKSAVAPGGTVTLAVRFAIEPKWHIYWENQGDSGMPTRAKITAPASWKVGELRFPAPQRHEDAGDITTYIHERELVLLADVQVPADAKPGTASISVEGRWLVCTDICVPGEGQAKVDVAVAEADKPANEAFFKTAREALPKPWSELSQARVTWSGTEAEPRFSVVVPGAKELEFFPLDTESMKLTGRSVDVGKNGATLKAQCSFERKEPTDQPRMRGVLRLKNDRGESSYLFDGSFTAPAGR
jgi:DsbC/DsbD-like thiol-disulfide interchange protein